MASTLRLILCLGLVGLSLANPTKDMVRWCVTSLPAKNKCNNLRDNCGSENLSLSCVMKATNTECFEAISQGHADAVTVDSGEIHKGSLAPYGLIPVVAENYGTEKEPNTCYHAIAVTKKSSNFILDGLKGKRSCHTGIGRSAGWNLPVAALLLKGLLKWEGPEDQSIQKAVTQFFSASCVPGATEPLLCKQCSGKDDNKCKASEKEPFYGYAGALKCLQQDKGDVAFVKDALPADLDKENYELLCLDNTRKAIDQFKECSWGRIPAHAVVTANKEDKVKAVVKFLEEAQKKPDCKLFSSEYGKDLMFKSSAKSLLTLPEKMNAALYLGPNYVNSIKALDQGVEAPSDNKIKWCTQSKEEQTKCDNWSIHSGGTINCIAAADAEECIFKVLTGEADAVTLDSGYLYTAGECGLVPAMQEVYDADLCKSRKEGKKGSYFAVAIVKKSNKNISWNNLKGTKSCHTGYRRTAGYNIPFGLIHKDTKSCDLGSFFSESCIPGWPDVDSNLCKLCAGNPDKPGSDSKCLPNNLERYYGYAGAFRCLIEGGGDVCFVKHTTIFDILQGQNVPTWAENWKPEDFECLCPDGTRRPVTEYRQCHLADVPPHAVAVTPGRREVVRRILKQQELQFGKLDQQGSQAFQMFVSEGRSDQLFKDSTKCLSDVPEDNMKAFLGKEYVEAITGLNECGKSGLLAACTFHTCRSQ